MPRLPQVSSGAAAMTGPIFSGSWDRTRRAIMRGPRAASPEAARLRCCVKCGRVGETGGAAAEPDVPTDDLAAGRSDQCTTAFGVACVRTRDRLQQAPTPPPATTDNVRPSSHAGRRTGPPTPIGSTWYAQPTEQGYQGQADHDNGHVAGRPGARHARRRHGHGRRQDHRDTDDRDAGGTGRASSQRRAGLNIGRRTSIGLRPARVRKA